MNKQQRDLYAILGDLPPQNFPIEVTQSRTVVYEDRTVEHLVLSLNGLEPVPALFIKPKNAAGPLPCVLYNHSHGGYFDLGKKELLEGVSYQFDTPYADSLVESGYAAFCLDAWCFGERRNRAQSDVAKELLWKGQTLWGLMVYDSLRALDYLVSRDDIDSARIATLGMSMGSTMAWWLAALDERIQVCVDICCLTEFDALIESNGLDEHDLYYYVPSLLKKFTTSSINALICPRPHLALAGRV